MDADSYLKHWERNRVWEHLQWPKHQQRLRRCAELTTGNRVLDVGCAFGHSTVIMYDFRRATWSGLDWSERAILKARAQFPQFQWHWAGEAGKLSALRWEFDSLVCSEVLEHVEDDRAFVDSVLPLALRVAVFTTPTRRVSDPGHLRIYDEKSLARLFDGRRFELMREEPFFYVTVRTGNGANG
jgi:2-polyprenyl-3-methyl-5-hydroxy-6-metoxy-1,4-benzoquinol methylase